MQDTISILTPNPNVGFGAFQLLLTDSSRKTETPTIQIVRHAKAEATESENQLEKAQSTKQEKKEPTFIKVNKNIVQFIAVFAFFIVVLLLVTKIRI